MTHIVRSPPHPPPPDDAAADNSHPIPQSSRSVHTVTRRATRSCCTRTRQCQPSVMAAVERPATERGTLTAPPTPSYHRSVQSPWPEVVAVLLDILVQLNRRTIFLSVQKNRFVVNVIVMIMPQRTTASACHKTQQIIYRCLLIFCICHLMTLLMGKYFG